MKAATKNCSVIQHKQEKFNNIRTVSKNEEEVFLNQVSLVIQTYKVCKLWKWTTFSKVFDQSCDVLFGIWPSKGQYNRLPRIGEEAHYLQKYQV